MAAKRILPPRKFPILTEHNVAAATPLAIIVADTDRFVQQPEKSLIWMPDPVRNDIEKNCEVGIVVAIGSKVPEDEVKVGDIILYRSRHAWRLPYGLKPPFMFKIDYPFSVIAKMGEGNIETDVIKTIA